MKILHLSHRKIICLILFLTTVVLSLAAVYLRPTTTQQSPWQEELEVLDVITRIVAVIDSNQNNNLATWDKFNLKSFPILITFDNEHVYLINPSSEISIRQLGEVVKTHAMNILRFDKQSRWEKEREQLFGSKESYIFHYEKSLEDPIEPFLTFVYQGFRRFQERNFKDFALPKEGYQDLFNADNLALMQIEEYFLTEGLRTFHDPKCTLTMQQAQWKEILNLMKVRRQLLTQPSIAWEDHQQRTKGLAEYVSMTTLFSMDCLSNFQPFHRLLNCFHRLKIDEEIIENVLESRHYAVGSLLAMSLDHFQVPNWKQRAENGDSLFALLDEYFGSQPVDRASIESLKEENDYPSWRKQAQVVIEDYRQDLEEIEQDCMASKGNIFRLEVPRSAQIIEHGICLYTYYMPEGSVLKVSDNSHLCSSDLLWNFKSTSMPFLLEVPLTYYEFKMEDSCMIEMDGWHKPVSELIATDQEIPFNRITWEGASCRFNSSLSGKLIVKSKIIHVHF